MKGGGRADFNSGLVLKKYSGFYYVQVHEEQIIECKLRGKVKSEIVLVGDRVRFTPTEENRGIIEEILPRSVALVRPAIANVDQFLLVMSYDQPAPSLKLLDRMLIMIEHLNLKPVIILNKCDLPGTQAVDIIRRYYPGIGYTVVLTSTTQIIGLPELSRAMDGRISVIAGPSGVGKTSLLNMMAPGRDLKTGMVSSKIGRGKHTTRHVELFPLPAGGWLADTPGFTVVELPNVKREGLRTLFPEFAGPTEDCRFADCLHAGEKDCGVKAAVAHGKILESRYQNYLACLDEVIAKEKCYQ